MATKLYIESDPVTNHTLGYFPNNAAGTVVAWRNGGLGTPKSSNQTFRQFNAVAGPTNGVESRASATGPTEWHWVSAPLAADVTISGDITFNIWMSEDVDATNAQVRCRVYKLSPDQSLQEGITEIVDSSKGSELPTGTAVQNWTATPTSTAFKKGDRIRVVILIDDAPSLTMAAGVCIMTFGNPTDGADGDTWLEFAETLTFMSDTASGGERLYLRSTQLFPSTFPEVASVTRDFNEADTNTITGNLTELGGSCGIASNELKWTVGTDGLVYFNGSKPSSALEISFKIAAVNGSDKLRAFWRMASAANRNNDPTTTSDWSGWFVELDPAAGTAKWFRTTGGVHTQVGVTTDVPGGLQAGDYFGVRCYNYVHHFMVKHAGGDWVRFGQDMTETVNFFDAGRMGLWPQSASVAFDDLRCAGIFNDEQAYYFNEMTRTRGTAKVDLADEESWGRNGPWSPEDFLYKWYSEPIQYAYTFGGMHLLHLRARFADTGSNVSLRAGIWICDGDGVRQHTHPLGIGSRVQTLTSTTETTYDLYIGCDDFDVSPGDRIEVLVAWDDNENTSYTVGDHLLIAVDGPTLGGAGDSYLELVQAFTEPITDEAPLRQGLTPLRWR